MSSIIDFKDVAYPGGRDYHEAQMRFREAATSGEFPSLLRSDYQDILLADYARAPQPLLSITYQTTSDRDEETYRGLKVLTEQILEVPEGGKYPEDMLDEKSTVTIANRKYGKIYAITREMIMFAKLAEIKRMASLNAEFLSTIYEKILVATIENTSNTTASASTLTLNRANLETVITAYRKQTDTAADGSSVKLGLVPDTLLVPPDLQFESQRLLNSTLIPGSANNDMNVLQGLLTIVVSHYLTSTSVWYVLKKNWANGLVVQNVIGPNPETFIQDVSGNNMPDGPFLYDEIKYRADLFFGAGVIDAKWAIRSTT